MNNKTEVKKRRNQKAFLYGFSIKNTVNNLLTEERGWGITSLNVPQTWSVTKGAGIKVLVIDTGYTTHSDLTGGMIKKQSKNFCRTESRIMDRNGHSTHCCGIIGARNNDSGVVGVAPECSIVTAKVLDRSGSGSIGDILKALRYAAKLKPDVISMSLGWYWHVPQVHNAIKLLYDMNIPVIAAAGNDGLDNSVNYPAMYPEVICVTAFDENGSPAWFNSTGSEVDFSAPGVDVYSTWLKNRYAYASGTSMATPFVAGVVALLIAKHKAQEAETGNNDCKTVAEIKEHLIKYADDKGIIGKDNTWGYGVINLPELIGDTCTI
jgi:subtilisin family serine protease